MNKIQSFLKKSIENIVILLRTMAYLIVAIYFIFGTLINGTIIHIPGDYPTVQQGIIAVNNGDTVLVDDDIYYENINLLGKGIVLASHFILDGDTMHIDSTIIDGGQPSHPDSGSVICCHTWEDSTSVIVGFTLQNGSGTYVPYMLHGGGISCWGASPTIKFNKIVNNSAGVGGGIGCSSDANAMIISNTLENNTGTGSAIICGGCSPLISKNLIFNNSDEAINLQYSSSMIINNTICHNHIGIKNSNHSFGTVINSIVYFNYEGQIYSSPESISVNYSDIQGGWPNTTNSGVYSVKNQFLYDYEAETWTNFGLLKNLSLFNKVYCMRDTGNIDADPLFVDTTNGDYHLSWENFPVPDSTKSPCIDAGDPSYPLDPDSTIADMGAFYFSQSTGIEEEFTKPIKDYHHVTIILAGPLLLPEDKNCKVFDITGRELDVNHLAPGIYFIEIQGQIVNKVVKVR